MASDAWPEDIPIWIDGTQKWMTGLTRRTTCDDVIYALLYSRGLLDTDTTDNYAVFERWRAVERPLQGRTKIVKVWTAWDTEQPNVQLLVQRLDDYFIPPQGAVSRARKRHHRRSSRQRARHSANCRCVGRPQCARCGRSKAVEQLVKHLVRQERQLQDLKRRVVEADRQIADHEARQHARRVQMDGLDYVQDSYLFHYGSDNSSSCASEDSLDCVLLAVGEEKLDEYLALCDRLYDVMKRLEHAEDTQSSLALEMEDAVFKDPPERSLGKGTAEDEKGDAEVQLEALQVQLTRAVAANILLQQQELDVAKELRLWETKIKDRWSMARQLEQELNFHELNEEGQQVAPSSCADCRVGDSTQVNSPNNSIFSSGQGNQVDRQRGPSLSTREELLVDSDYVSDAPLSVRAECSVSMQGLEFDEKSNLRLPSHEPLVAPRYKSQTTERNERLNPPVSTPKPPHNQHTPSTRQTHDVQFHGDSGNGTGYALEKQSVAKIPVEVHERSKECDKSVAVSGESFPLTYNSPQYHVPKSHSLSEHYLNFVPPSRMNGHRSRQQDVHQVGKLCSVDTANHAFPFPGLAGRPLELYSSSKDDSGVSSSDSSTDSGPLVFESPDQADHIRQTTSRRQQPPYCFDPDSVLDVSVSYSDHNESVRSDNRTLPHPPSWLPVSTMTTRSSGPGYGLGFEPSKKLHDKDDIAKKLADCVVGGKCNSYTTDTRTRSGYDEQNSTHTVPAAAAVTNPGQQLAGAHPVSIISGRNKAQNKKTSSALTPAKTVRFAEKMTSWWVCDDAYSSDDTGLSSIHDDEALETLV